MQQRLSEARKFNRSAALLGLLSVLIFITSDWLFEPDLLTQLLPYRLVGIGICMLVFLICEKEGMVRWLDLLISLGVFAFYYTSSFLVFGIFPSEMASRFILPSALLCMFAVFSLIDLRLGFRIVTGMAIASLAFYQEVFHMTSSSYNFPHYAAGLLIGCGGAYLMERYRRLNFYHDREAQIERQKSERLLLNILPAPIAERLRNEHKALADGFEEVTVLFADIVGFTPLSERMEPQTLLGHLNRIFSDFDALAEKHGLEKIKTIGDAYMVAGGLPIEQPDHAERVARMALDIQAEIHNYAQELGEELQLRIGMHMGPVVAGVIGRKKFIYDLWGDTVNTASRMESHGLPGKIQVSEALYERLKDNFELETRGLIPIKGKAQMQVYFLLAERQTEPVLVS